MSVRTRAIVSAVIGIMAFLAWTGGNVDMSAAAASQAFAHIDSVVFWGTSYLNRPTRYRLRRRL